MNPLLQQVSGDQPPARESPSAPRCSAAVYSSPPFVSVTQAAEALRGKQISSRELTGDLLDRIETFNTDLNAVVTLDPERALAAATGADEALSRGEAYGPLHGVPCCVKDTFEVAGMRTTAGSRNLAEYMPAKDADVVMKLRAAGAIILGKTNTPPFGGDWQTSNDIFGTTNNPWDLARTPGGSTGGGAAAVAAGLEYFTVGSDLGGSVRGPAHFCGVYGHRASLNVVSLRGHIPPYPVNPLPDADLLVAAGPLARTATDLRLALTVVGGPGGDDAKAYRWSLPPARRQAFRDYRIGYVFDDPACPVSTEVLTALLGVLQVLERLGVSARRGWPRGLDPSGHREIYEYIAATYRAPAFTERRLKVLRERAANPEGGLGDIFAKALTQPVRYYQRALRSRAEARLLWQDYFRDFDAFLAPVTFVAAFPHDLSTQQSSRILQTDQGPRPYLDLPFWCSFASLAGLPVTVAPIGQTPSGLPVGLQIIGPYLEDATPIDIALRLADHVGFHPPSRPPLPAHPERETSAWSGHR